MDKRNGGAAAFGYSFIKTLILVAILAVLTLFPLGAALNAEAGLGFVALFAMTSAFFGVWLLAMLARLLWRGPVLTVSREGIRDRRIGDQTIPWARVRQVYVFRARSQIFLAVVPDAPEDFIAPPGPLEKLALWASDALRLPRFSISLMGLNASQRTIMLAFRRHMPAGVATDPKGLPRGI